MKKIGFLINTLSKSGGTERVTTVLANALAEAGYEVEIICMFNGGESFYKLDDRVALKVLTDKPHGTLKYYFKVLWQLKKHSTHLDYIVGVGMDLCIFTIPLRLFSKIKVIGWEHFNLNVKGPVVNLARRLGILFADHIVTLTGKDCEVYSRRTSKAICIYNPVTIESAPIQSYDEKTVLCVGRLTHQKGLDLLLDVWAMRSDAHKGWKLVIVGDGQDEAALKAQAERLNILHTISFVKATRDIVSYYRAASIYVMTSRYEGLPLVLIEAEAMGLPIVAFNCETGPREVVIDNVNGFLVPAFDKAVFSERLQQLMTDRELREKMGRQSVINSAKFMKNSIVKQWTEILV